MIHYSAEAVSFLWQSFASRQSSFDDGPTIKVDKVISLMMDGPSSELDVDSFTTSCHFMAEFRKLATLLTITKRNKDF